MVYIPIVIAGTALIIAMMAKSYHETTNPQFADVGDRPIRSLAIIEAEMTAITSAFLNDDIEEDEWRSEIADLEAELRRAAMARR